jgi:Uma2 family endonuclease
MTMIDGIEYLAFDGKPMAETGVHVRAMAWLYLMLRVFFRHRPDVYVGANMFMYYEEGNPKRVVAPDVFVVFGAANARVEHRSWFVWKEGKAPDVIFELTSQGTKDEDVDFKQRLYEQLGVTEYFLFDPLDEYLRPNLQGFQLAQEKYQPIPAKRGELNSQILGLVLRPAGRELRLFDRASGTRLLPPAELAEANLELNTLLDDAEKRASAAQAAAEQEAQACQAAETELARAREELARLRGEKPE